MKRLILKMMNKANAKLAVLIVALFFSGLAGNAQNVNIPNRTGPMGLEVNSYTGNLYFHRSDFVIPGQELGMQIGFSYNSYDMDIQRGYGNGWSFEYSTKYYMDTSGNTVIVWGDGREDAYTPLGSGNFKSPTGFFTVLKEYEPGKFSITEPNGLKYLFENATNKRLTKIETPNAHTISISYNDTLITSLSNHLGQAISFTYDGKGLLKTVTDAVTSPTRIWQYNYDAVGNLTQVKDPLGASDRYTYLTNGPVQTISDKNLNVVDIVYYNDFSVHEMVGCNQHISFSYDRDQKLTVVTDHLESGVNQVNKYYYQEHNNLVWLSAISSNCCGLDTKIEYDEQGNKIRETDANGNETKFTYDNKGNLLTVTDALNQTTAFTYTAGLNRVSSVTDPKGNVSQMEYDARGNLTKITEPDNSTYTATYDASGNMLSSTNANGKTFNYTYDANGHLKSITGPEGVNIAMNISRRGDVLDFTDEKNHTHTFEYDILGRMTQLTDPLNNNAKFSYDAMGNLIVMRNKNNEPLNLNYDASNRIRKIDVPNGYHLTFDYDGMDNLTGVTDAEGTKVKFKYDKRNLLSSIVNAEGLETTFHYDAAGNLITGNAPNGQSVTYTYDKLNRIIESSDQSGSLGSVVYDANGNVTQITDANGANYSVEYNDLNQITKVTDPLGNEEHYTYTPAGEIATITDAAGNTVSVTYDDLDRVISVTDRNGSVTTIGYDATGNITSLKDANNNTTTYSYDALDRVIRVTFPDGKYKEYGYDLKNNIISYKLKDGEVINFEYDSLNRVTTKTLPDGRVFSYGYDNVGRVITAVNNADTVYFAYDLMNRVTSEKYKGRKVSYEYSTTFRTQKTIYPDSTIVLKTFDERDRLVSIKKNGETLVSFQYNNADQVIAKTFGNGVTSGLQYDFAGRLTNILTGSFQNMAFTYDNKGNIASIIRDESNLSEFFTYDNNDRLLTYKRGKPGGPFTINDSYTYDALGNRISASIGGKSFSYTTNNLNQMLTSYDGTTAKNYVYDLNGNLIFDGKYYKTYDAEKRLLRDSASTSEVIKYQYDAVGRRIGKTINGVAFHYTYSGLNRIEERDASDVIRNKTIFKNYLEPIVNEKNDIPFYYHNNHQNSIAAMTDVSGDLIEQYRYDVYGSQSIFDGSGSPLPGSITGNYYGFTGQVYDSATQDLQFYFRTYDPETGVFGQQDLIGYGDGMGMYQYVGNNPANGIDILGLMGMVEPNHPPYYPPPSPPSPKDPCSKASSSPNVPQELLDGYNNILALLKQLGEARKAGRVLEKEKAGKLLISLAKYAGQLGKQGAISSEFLAKNQQLLNKATEVIEAGFQESKAFNGISKAGAGLDLVMKTKAMLDVSSDPSSSYNQYLEARSDLALSALGILDPTSVSSFYSLGDMAINKMTGNGSLVHQSTTAGYYYGAKFWGWWYDVDIPEFDNPYDKPGSLRGINCPQNNKPNGTQRPPHGPNGGGAGGIVEIIQSHDPNEIIGPAGQPDKRWVSVKDRLPYTVTFENSEMASAPAKYVKVIVPVQDKMDPSTFELANLGFNNQSFTVPVAATSRYERLDARDSLGLYVDMTAGYNVQKGEFFWEFQSIDPVTLMPPTDPLKGFLLLQNATEEKTKNGHGFVNFTVKPDANAHTLDSIIASAKIVFDLNDTIPTNIEHNIIDAVAPTSQLNGLEASYNNFIPLSWSGQDDPNGCGVDYYTLYVSTDGTNFSILKDKIKRTDTSFTGMPNTTYFFFVLATDSVGNTEKLGAGAIQNTYLGIVVPVSWLYFKGTNKGTDNLLEWATANETNAKEYRVERSFDGQHFETIGSVGATGNTTGNSSYQYTDRDVDKLGATVMYYRLAQVDRDGKMNYSNVIRINYASDKVSKAIVYPNPTKGLITVVLGDKRLAGTVATVYDEAGKLLQSVKITSVQQQFDFGGYSNGIYFIRLANKEVLKVMKH